MAGKISGATIKERNIYEQLDRVPSEQLTDILLKAFSAHEGFTLPIPSSISTNYEPDITDARKWDEFVEWERAIHPISNYYNTLGIARPYFSKAANDVLASTPYYAICEKSICDYTAALEFGVYDRDNQHVADMDDFLDYPGPHRTFGDVTKKYLPDLTRYDAAVMVKTFNRKGKCVEFDSYLGTEFWKEIDRVPVGINLGHLPAARQIGYYSHGHVQRYWQRSRTGVYVSFQPDEIAYMSMYPRNDTIYGTDWISCLKAPIQYLIDSTRAAGKTFQNGVVPSLVYKHPQITDRKQLMQRLADLKANNQGPMKFGGTLHLVKDEEVETLSHKLHDMEWLEGQKFMAQLVWSMWGFQPQEFVGESANRACYSEDTEVLTENGWKLHKDVCEGERIAVYDKDVAVCKLEVPGPLHTYHADEELVRFETNAQDVLVTKEHTILRRTSHGKKDSPWIVSKAKEIVGKRIAVKAGTESWAGEEQEVEDDYLRFLGWAISEGGLSSTGRENDYYHMTFAQSNTTPHRVEELERVLTSLGVKCKKYQSEKDNTTRWNVYGKELIEPLFDLIGAYSPEKHIPRQYLNLPKEKLNCLFESLMMGDGHWDTRAPRVSGYYSTTSSQLADDFQELAFKCGYGTKRTVHYYANGNRVTCYRVLVQKKIIREVVSPKLEQYSGNVYCFSTSTGFYVTRRNGCVAVQGNTAYVSRNITKSKMLYPIMKYLEVVFTRDILPYCEGYEKGMRFKFEVEQDLDDTMKVAETKLAQSQAAKTMFEMGIKNRDAARLAGLTKEHDVVEFEDISVQDLNQSQQLEGGKPSEPNRGRKTQQSGPDKGKGGKDKIKFGDKEERSAGIKKATTEIRLIGDDGAEVTIVPAGPSVSTNKKGCASEVARGIIKEVRAITHHRWDRMRDPCVWDGAVAKAVEDFGLVVFMGE
ncbi:MAG: phage portal protein [Bacilli bacterium]